MDSNADTDSQTKKQSQETDSGGYEVARRLRHGIDDRFHISPDGGTGGNSKNCDEASQDPRCNCKNDQLRNSPSSGLYPRCFRS